MCIQPCNSLYVELYFIIDKSFETTLTNMLYRIADFQKKVLIFLTMFSLEFRNK